MSKHQKYFVDQLFSDRAKIIEKSLFFGEGSKKKADPLKKDALSSPNHSLSYEKLKKTLNLQPVQYDIKEASHNIFGVENILEHEEARNRIMKLVEKQKGTQAHGQLPKPKPKEIETARLAGAVEKSYAEIHRIGPEKKCSQFTPVKELSENRLKRKVVQCAKASPGRVAFSRTFTATGNTQNSHRGLTRANTLARDKVPSKAPDVSKREPIPTRSNIYARAECKKLISHHLEKPKIDGKNSRLTPEMPSDVVAWNKEVSPVSSSSTQGAKTPRFLKAKIVKNDLVHVKCNSKPKLQLGTTSPKQASDNSIGSKDGRARHRRIVKVRQNQKTSPQDSEGKEEKSAKQKCYDVEDVQKYMQQKRVDRRKHVTNVRQEETRRKEEKEQTMKSLIQHQRATVRNAAKAPSRLKRTDESTEGSCQASAWEEVFDALESRAMSSGEKTASKKESNETTLMTISMATTSKFSYSPSASKIVHREEASCEMTSMAVSDGRLKKIQESADLLSLKLGFQTSEIFSRFKADNLSFKSLINSSIGDSKLDFCPSSTSLPLRLPTAYRSIQEANDIQLTSTTKPINSPKDTSNDNGHEQQHPTTPVLGISFTQPLEKKNGYNYLRIPDALGQLDEVVNKGFSAVSASLSLPRSGDDASRSITEIEKGMENLPRDMFPSEDLRKKLSKKASLFTSEDKTSLFGEVQASKKRLSFGADSSFDEFNWKLIHSFLSKEESRLTYQTSMRKIKERALDDQSKATSVVSESSLPFVSRRGMDDVYPRRIRATTNDTILGNSSADVSSCEENTFGLGASRGQTSVEASESSEAVQLVKRISQKTNSKRSLPSLLNIKLGERFIAKKEENLKQRKERLAKLLERLDSLDCTEKEVQEMEIEISRRWKNLESKSNQTEMENNLREMAVQTLISPCPTSMGYIEAGNQLEHSAVGNLSRSENARDSIDLSVAKINNTKGSTNSQKFSSKISPIHSYSEKSLQINRAIENAEVVENIDFLDIFSPARDNASQRPTTSFEIHEGRQSFNIETGFAEKIIEVDGKISMDSLEVTQDVEQKPKPVESLELEDSLGELRVGDCNQRIDSSASEGRPSPISDGVGRSMHSDEDVLLSPLNCPIGSSLKRDREHLEVKLEDFDIVGYSEAHDDFQKQEGDAESLVRNGDQFVKNSLSSDSFLSKDSLSAVSETAKAAGDSLTGKPLELDDCIDVVLRNDSIDERNEFVNPADEVASVESEDTSLGRFLHKTESSELAKVIESVDAAVSHFDHYDLDPESIGDLPLNDKDVTLGGDRPTEPASPGMVREEESKQEDEIRSSLLKIQESVASEVAGEILRDSIDVVFAARRNKESSLLKARDGKSLSAKQKHEADNLMISDEWIDDECFVELNDGSKEKDPTLERVVNKESVATEMDEIFYIPRSQEELSAIVSEYLDAFWAQRRNGEPLHNTSPPEDILNRGPGETYRVFLFDLVGEILVDLYPGEEDAPNDENSGIVRNVVDFLLFDRKNSVKKNLHRGLEDLRPIVIDLVLSLLPPNNDFVVAKPSIADRIANTMNNKQGRDRRVESLLSRELKLEEPEWINYDEDSEVVKNSIADSIFKSLLDDAASSVGAAFRSKNSSSTHGR